MMAMRANPSFERDAASGENGVRDLYSEGLAFSSSRHRGWDDGAG